MRSISENTGPIEASMPVMVCRLSPKSDLIVRFSNISGPVVKPVSISVDMWLSPPLNVNARSTAWVDACFMEISSVSLCVDVRLKVPMSR
ncbi:hypothetical protein D3C78_1717580 [compost metagenome]